MTLLFLNSLGTGEVILIMFVVLILFGSKGIPGVVKNLGRGLNEIRNASNEIKRDIQKAGLEMRKDLQIDDTVDQIKKDLEPPKDTFSINSDNKNLSSDAHNQDEDKLKNSDQTDTDQKEKSA